MVGGREETLQRRFERSATAQMECHFGRDDPRATRKNDKAMPIPNLFVAKPSWRMSRLVTPKP